MLQNGIVYLIVFISIVYTVYAIVKSLRTKEKSGCEGCNGCDIKNEINKNISTGVISKKACSK